jgi:hypothetical protein
LLLKREEETYFFYSGWKSNRRSASYFYLVNTPTKPMEKERNGSWLKYIGLCARQIAKVAKDNKIVVENRHFRAYCWGYKSILDNTGNGVQFQILSNPEFYRGNCCGWFITSRPNINGGFLWGRTKQ